MVKTHILGFGFCVVLAVDSPLIFSKENFHGQNPYFGFRICVVLAVDSPLIFSKTRLNSSGQIRVFKPI
jgi:hypothetical protein